MNWHADDDKRKHNGGEWWHLQYLFVNNLDQSYDYTKINKKLELLFLMQLIYHVEFPTNYL